MDAGNATNHRDTLRRLLADFEYAMLTSRALDGALDSRPVQILQVDAECVIWFFTNAASAKVEEIRDEPRVVLACADTARKIFVAVAGVAEIIVDRRKIEELWTPAQTVFFPEGRDDPSLRLLKITPTSARHWDGNESTIGMLLKFGKAVLRGQASDLGRSDRFDLDEDA
jgi:general stress protein 26